MDKLNLRLAEIVASLTAFQALEGLTTEQTEEVTTLTAEANEINAQLQAKADMANVLAFSTKVEPKVKTAKKVITAGTERKMDNGNHGFESAGAFFMALKSDPRGNTNENLKVLASQREKVGEDGGFLVPADMLDGVQKKIDGDESLLSRCRQLKTSGNRITIPVDETAPWSGNASNFEAEWVGEEKTAGESKKKMGEADIKLHKLQAKISVTDEMLEDAPLIESMIMSDAPEVIMAKINDAIISGNGIKKPSGILNSGFAYEVAKESGQDADTLVFENLKKLYTHALPRAKKNGVFLYNVACEEQLIGMKLDASSTDSMSVYLPNNSIAGAPYGTLWGKPVFPMAGAMPALGDAGDIVFVDLSYYYAALKTGGIKKQVSIHALWDEDKTSFKFTFRMGGQCPFKVPASTQYGDYKLSGLLHLQARA
jgi:HK97 family phage major capsid protein